MSTDCLLSSPLFPKDSRVYRLVEHLYTVLCYTGFIQGLSPPPTPPKSRIAQCVPNVLHSYSIKFSMEVLHFFGIIINGARGLIYWTLSILYIYKIILSLYKYIHYHYISNNSFILVYLPGLGNLYLPLTNCSSPSRTFFSRNRFKSSTLHWLVLGPLIANILNIEWIRSSGRLSRFVNIPTI